MMTAFAGVPTAYRSGALAPVTGSFPRSLDGLYLRKGPNLAFVPYEGPYHWFLPDGMLYGVRIRDGNRWARAEALATKIDVALLPNTYVDATNLNGKPQAVIKLPERVPLGATEAGPE